MATRINLVEDVLPISDLRLRAAQQIEKIQETKRPLVITQYGKAVAVLLEISQFQTVQDELTVLEERVRSLEKELAEARLALALGQKEVENGSQAWRYDKLHQEVAETEEYPGLE